MKKNLIILFILFSCSNKQKNTSDSNNEIKKAELEIKGDSVNVYLKKNYLPSNQNQTLKLLGQWRFDSILKQNNFFPIGESCKAFYDWGGFNEGYCVNRGDFEGISTDLIYHVTGDTLNIHWWTNKNNKNEAPNFSKKTIKSQFLIINADSVNKLVLLNLKTNNLEFHSRFD